MINTQLYTTIIFFIFTTSCQKSSYSNSIKEDSLEYLLCYNFPCDSFFGMSVKVKSDNTYPFTTIKHVQCNINAKDEYLQVIQLWEDEKIGHNLYNTDTIKFELTPDFSKEGFLITPEKEKPYLSVADTLILKSRAIFQDSCVINDNNASLLTTYMAIDSSGNTVLFWNNSFGVIRLIIKENNGSVELFYPQNDRIKSLIEKTYKIYPPL